MKVICFFMKLFVNELLSTSKFQPVSSSIYQNFVPIAYKTTVQKFNAIIMVMSEALWA